MLDQGNTLLEIADEIDRVLRELQDENHAMHHYEMLYRQLSFYESLPNKLNYQVYQREKMIAPYLLAHWALCSRGIDNYNMLEALSKKTREIFIPSSNAGISESMVHLLMNHVEQRFGYCSKVLQGKSLRIIITEDAYKYGNSLVMTYSVQSKNYADKRDLVVLTRVNDHVAPEFAFLHELGHILHLRITQQYEKYVPPKSFDLVLNKMFHGPDGKTDEIKAELFAESFAIASLFDSSYSQYDHANFVSDENKQFTYQYFSALMAMYEESNK